MKGRLWTPGKRSWAEAYRWGHAEPKVERVDSAVRSAHGTVGVGSGGQTDGKAGSGASVIPSRRERGLESGRRKAGAPRQRHRSGPRLRVGRPEESSQQDRHRPPPQQKRPAGPGSKVVRRPFQGASDRFSLWEDLLPLFARGWLFDQCVRVVIIGVLIRKTVGIKFQDTNKCFGKSLFILFRLPAKSSFCIPIGSETARLTLNLGI